MDVQGRALRDWLSDRRVFAALCGVGIVIWLPYVIAGPGFFLDDWFTLRNAEVDGWAQAAGPQQWRARPGAAVVYALSFGLLRDRATLFVVIAAALMVGNAALLVHVLQKWLPRLVSVAVAFVWLAQPNHLSLELWPSALNITLSLTLALAGLLLAMRSNPSIRTDIASALVLAFSLLCYEATGPMAGVIVLAVAAGRARRDGLRLVVVQGAIVGAAGLWMVVNWHPGKQGLDQWADLSAVLPAHLGRSVFGSSVVGDIAGLVLLVVASAIAAFAILPDRRHLIDWEARALGFGLLVIVVGTVPFVRYFYSPLGLGDRVTVVSGVGGALVLVACVGFVARQARIPGMGLAGLLIVAAVVFRIDMMSSFATAADDGERILDAVQERFPEPPDETIVLGPYPVVDRNIVAIINADWPLQFRYGTLDVTVRTVFEEADFDDADPEFKVNIVELSNLESERRVYPG